MAAQNCNRSLPFLVFPSLAPVMTWRVVATESNRTISFHKNLNLAVEKAERLNTVALAMPKAVYSSPDTFFERETRGSCQCFYDTSWAEAQSVQCDGIGSISDRETGATWCLRCWLVNHGN